MTNLFFLLFFILICFVCFLNLGSYVPHYCSVWCRWFHSIWKIYTRTTLIFNRNCSVPPITHVYVRIPLLLYRQSADVFFTWASFAFVLFIGGGLSSVGNETGDGQWYHQEEPVSRLASQIWCIILYFKPK